MSKIMVNVNDGYTGNTIDLEVKVVEDKIYFNNGENICYWSGAKVNRKFKGTNQITLPIRRYVNGLQVRPVQGKS